MKQLKIIFYIIISLTFIYILFNLSAAIENISISIITFFSSLFPYLLLFLIFNQILIKTQLIHLFGYLLQFFFYPIFKTNAKSCSLLLLAILNGYPTSIMYATIIDKDLKYKSTKNISYYFFLPSFTFVFYLIKTSISPFIFNLFAIALYVPPFILLFAKRKEINDNYMNFANIKNDIIESFKNFNYVEDMKNIFTKSIASMVNIFGMICFYSITTLIIPSYIFKGLFEFSIPSLNILKSNIKEIYKCILLLIILTFSSLSCISQACIYFEDLQIKSVKFISIRLLMIALSLLIFTVSFYFYFL